MAAPRYDITVERGVTFSLPVTWRDSAGALVDLSGGYTARLSVKAGEPESPGAEVVTLTDAAGLTLAATAPNLTAALTATQTRALTAGHSLCYDLRLYSGGTEYRLLYGSVSVLEQVTAPS